MIIYVLCFLFHDPTWTQFSNHGSKRAEFTLCIKVVNIVIVIFLPSFLPSFIDVHCCSALGDEMFFLFISLSLLLSLPYLPKHLFLILISLFNTSTIVFNVQLGNVFSINA